MNFVSREHRALAHRIRAREGRSIAVKGDVSERAQVLELFRQTVDKVGAADIPFNNTGLPQEGSLGYATTMILQ
jgi:NAD(P)-dependent dehydrogenase (short-subunit alcohol dehydrogenase family)